MKKIITCTAAACVAVAGVAHGAAYRIPEQSINSTARSGAYTAYTPSADSAYANPANMAWLSDTAHFELDATWIHLDSISYTDNRTPLYSGESEEEDFLMPTFFAVSPVYNKFRFGFALTAPGGLSKQWKDPFPRTFAEEFSLKIIEANPTVSYQISDMVSVAAGLRSIYIDGKVKSNGTVNGISASRDMEGDAWEWGYNLALTVRPTEEMSLAVTYRSNVDLGIEGTAHLSSSTGATYDGETGVEIPLPAVLAIAGSYTFFDQLTVELQYERTFWSEYDELDFTYPSDLSNPILRGFFDDSKPKNWSDTNSWRIGLEYDFKNNIVLMAGFALDENPAPEDTIGFELPDSDARLYSIGLRYKATENMEFGIAYLYDEKESRTVSNSTIDGEFTDAAAHLITLGFSYTL